MIGVLINGAMLLIWLTIWGTTGTLMLPAICISLLGMLIFFLLEVMLG